MGPARDKHGVSESFAKVNFLFAKNGRSRIKEFESKPMYVCMYVCMYACMYVCMYACMHVCMYVCMFVCVYVCN